MSVMHNEFTAIVEQDGPWYIAYCAEVPGANGQGTSREACLANLREAIALILEHRREGSLRSTASRRQAGTRRNRMIVESFVRLRRSPDFNSNVALSQSRVAPHSTGERNGDWSGLAAILRDPAVLESPWKYSHE